MTHQYTKDDVRNQLLGLDGWSGRASIVAPVTPEGEDEYDPEEPEHIIASLDAWAGDEHSDEHIRYVAHRLDWLVEHMIDDHVELNPDWHEQHDALSYAVYDRYRFGDDMIVCITTAETLADVWQDDEARWIVVNYNV